MNTHPRNKCPAHEWADDLSEPGLQRCDWCGQTRETPVEVRAGVDVPHGAVVVGPTRAAA